jgi:hypothetical protein
MRPARRLQHDLHIREDLLNMANDWIAKGVDWTLRIHKYGTSALRQDRGSDDAVSQQGKDDVTKVLQLRPSSVRCLSITRLHHHEYRTVPVPA